MPQTPTSQITVYYNNRLNSSKLLHKVKFYCADFLRHVINCFAEYVIVLPSFVSTAGIEIDPDVSDSDGEWTKLVTHLKAYTIELYLMSALLYVLWM